MTNRAGLSSVSVHHLNRGGRRITALRANFRELRNGLNQASPVEGQHRHMRSSLRTKGTRCAEKERMARHQRRPVVWRCRRTNPLCGSVRLELMDQVIFFSYRLKKFRSHLAFERVVSLQFPRAVKGRGLN